MHAAAPVWSELADAQAGVVARRQLLALGLTPGGVGALLDAGRWTGLLPGVYATFTGPLPASARIWGAVLYAGRPAAVGGSSALWLCGVLDTAPEVVTVCVPQSRRVRPQPGVRIVTRTALASCVHPVALPPRLRLEAALLDVTHDAADAGRVVDLVLLATRARHTTAARLSQALANRRRHRWRRLVVELLAEAADGVQSPLEHRWLHDVERRHGLPRAERNRPEDGADGRRRYHDLRYRPWRLVVELDGREAHPDWARFRDRGRDNALTEAGEVTLRYGWREVVTHPCEVAAQVVRVLRLHGWTGTPRPCRPGCPLSRRCADSLVGAEDSCGSLPRESPGGRARSQDPGQRGQ
ncbi:MAG: type IV toxin-antitoxin system AbiEi family antitoxin [Kineosporiaceae bacterium]